MKVPSVVLARRRKLNQPLVLLSQELDQYLAGGRRRKDLSPVLFSDIGSKSPKAIYAERRGSQVINSSKREASRTRFFSIPESLRSSPIPYQPSIDPPNGHFRTRSEVLFPPVKSLDRRNSKQEQFTNDRLNYEQSVYSLLGHTGTSRFLMRHHRMSS